MTEPETIPARSENDKEATLPARGEFEVCRNLSYLDVATRAPLANRVHEELTRYLEACRRSGGNKEGWFATQAHVRQQVANLLHATTREVAFVGSTSAGLNTVAQGLSLRAGANVIVCPEFEHGNNLYPWLHLRRSGVQVRMVNSGNAVPSVKLLERHVDRNTALIAVSWVSLLTGGRSDLAALGDLAHSVGALLVVDAVQGLGVLEMDAHASGVDVMCAATQKGLLGLYGLGILYCSSEAQELIAPPFLSRNAVDLGNAHESEVDMSGSYQLYNDARKYEVGNPNFPAIHALRGALSILEEFGQPAIENHALTLSSRLVDELRQLGLRVVTPDDSLQRSSIVSFEYPNATHAAKSLELRGIRVAPRRGLLRASVHLFNNESDVLRLVEALRDAHFGE